MTRSGDVDRRTFLTASVMAGIFSRTGLAQTGTMERTIQTPVLNVGYEESGNATGFPIILLHGFPDDVHAYDDVVPPLANAGHRVFVPYLRGYGKTSFRDANAPRMAEQAAIGQDLIDFADALKLDRFAVAGYDWGGRAAGVAAALHPDRVRAVVLVGGYSIQDVFSAPHPSPQVEATFWYRWSSTPSVDASASRRIVAASSSGSSGRRRGSSPTRRTRRRRRHSTIPTSSIASSTRIVIAT